MFGAIAAVGSLSELGPLWSGKQSFGNDSREGQPCKLR